MSETVLATASERQKWINQYFSEYVRASQFKPYMGKSPMSIIVVKYELQTESGKTINIPLITRLKGDGVTGSQVLEGNEEALGNYNCAISVDWRRHGVTVPKSTSYKTEIDLLGAAKEMLIDWESEKMRDDVITALLAVIASSSATSQTAYGTITDSANGGREITSANYIASESDKDTWLTNNSDRILFGATIGNTSAGDHSASLLNVDTTADKLTTAIGSNAKLMAKTAKNRRIRPFRTKDGREYFVMFCNPWAFRDLKVNDSALLNANREARPRDVEANPIFQDGDVIYDGVIYRQVEELPVLSDAGNGGTTDVAVNVLCGAQAAGVAWGQEPTPVTDLTRDYKFRPGVGIEELLGVSKLHYQGVQQGSVTVYTATTPGAA